MFPPWLTRSIVLHSKAAANTTKLSPPAKSTRANEPYTTATIRSAMNRITAATVCTATVRVIELKAYAVRLHACEGRQRAHLVEHAAHAGQQRIHIRRVCIRHVHSRRCTSVRARRLCGPSRYSRFRESEHGTAKNATPAGDLLHFCPKSA
eukprot:CAMPEP_0183331978 /NCGR_PEP_ID=MMETSP0164_2-20130417/1250_1 /TAXON_ID=221442 /ORGANISM="Coccolithus pelagicus ssp braarudi, Strain PLY182g" /LENGTH=150 /DNA_ID=CAMNT_0025500599 /DNA_START=736 /DNA_END=1185 /DNA_ORIENTATION=+